MEQSITFSSRKGVILLLLSLLFHFFAARAAPQNTTAEVEQQGQRLQHYLTKYRTLNITALNITKSKDLAKLTKIHTAFFELRNNFSIIPPPDFREVDEALGQLHKKLYPWLRQSPRELYNSFARQNVLNKTERSIKNSTRGIVFTTGSNLVFYTYLAITALRLVNCTLPMTIAYGGDSDLPKDKRDWLMNKTENPKFPTLNFVDILAEMGSNEGREFAAPRGWANKPFALLYAPYRESLFVDSDSFFLYDPEIALMDSDPDYKREGALFFRDRTIVAVAGDKVLWRGARWLLENLNPNISRYSDKLRFMHGETQHEIESGVVLEDKGRVHVFLGLLAACSLNTVAIRDGEVYNAVYGDKETFWMGPEMAEASGGGYAIHPGRTGSLGFRVLKTEQTDNDTPTNVTCGVMAHEGRNHDLLWFNGGLQLFKHIRVPTPNVEIRFEEIAYEPSDKKQTEFPEKRREKWWWGFGGLDNTGGFMCLKVLPGNLVTLSSEERVILMGLQKLLAQGE